MKSKLYYNTNTGELFLSTGNVSPVCTDKIAVNCPTPEDVDYVNSKSGTHFRPLKSYYPSVYVWLDGDNAFDSSRNHTKDCGYHIITIHRFKQQYEDQKMKTKVTIIGKAEAAVPEPKPIEFVKFWDESDKICKPMCAPSLWQNIELISSNYRGTGYDLMFAYQDGHRSGTVSNAIYLGYFNDGIV